MSMMPTDSVWRNRPDEPYNDLPLLPPRQELETKAVLKVALAAHVALANLRSAAKQIPNDGILVRAIALQEARTSSEIEMIVTTNDALYRALSHDEDSVDPQTKEVLQYDAALWLGYYHLRKVGRIDPDLLVRLAQTIAKRPIGIREGFGTRIGDARTGRVIYTPPVGKDRILGLLANLCDYWQHDSEVDVLVRMCVGHYQFEAIHPFPDTNGRVGRVSNILFLNQVGLLDSPILYLSRPIIEDKATYYQGLRRVTEQGVWEPWLLYMLGNLESTAVETRRRIEAIDRSIAEATSLAASGMRKGFSPELIRLIFTQPYTLISFLEREGIAKRQTASEYLQELERLGLVRADKRGREVYYINDRLLEILSL